MDTLRQHQNIPNRRRAWAVSIAFMLLAVTAARANSTNTIPYTNSFEYYVTGTNLVGSDGWYGSPEETENALIVTSASDTAAIIDYQLSAGIPLSTNDYTHEKFFKLDSPL
ncbi:MAG: hypothetical protein R6V03_00365, partial [Kiritimatiellia bacterium]